MRDDVPAYLTDRDRAEAERQAWENEIHASILSTLDDHRQALTAASFPHWASVVSNILASVKRIPHNLMARLLHEEPHDDSETHQEIADRIAPTLATAAYNVNVLQELVAFDLPYKEWVTKHDDRVRPTHRAADGQRVPLSAPFLVGGQYLQYPADSRTAAIELWFNCRCVIVGRMER